ncbi:MAG TPA: hypothetical protein VHF92_04880 [Geodermatophilus sp.]|nr:hypothetical protein [Geodermatophilus sp.]
MATLAQRIAYRMFTRQARKHEVEPALMERLWADGEIRRFWLDQAQCALDDIQAENAAGGVQRGAGAPFLAAA